MPNLLQQFECLSGRVCFLGLGNKDYGDDGFGVRLAERLIEQGMADVIVAGTVPERWIAQAGSYDHIVFVDAVEFGGEPGDVVFLDSSEMIARFPQISTHKISLGVLAQWAEGNGRTRAWLLGVQPESLKTQQLSPALRKTLEGLCKVIKTTTCREETEVLAREERATEVKAC